MALFLSVVISSFLIYLLMIVDVVTLSFENNTFVTQNSRHLADSSLSEKWDMINNVFGEQHTNSAFVNDVRVFKLSQDFTTANIMHQKINLGDNVKPDAVNIIQNNIISQYEGFRIGCINYTSGGLMSKYTVLVIQP